MNQLQPPASTDLILQLFGGNRNGELITVDTPKCLLGSEQSAEGDRSSQCAIFRGPEGATFRSYCDNILVNGEPKTTHWLCVGDKIEFPNSIMIEVQQLGSCEIGEGEFAGYQNNENNLMQDSTSHSETMSDSFSPIPDHAQMPTGEPQQSTPETREVDLESPKLDELESQITEIRLQSEQFDGRFEHLEGRLNQLTKKISQLIDIATSNQADESNTEYVSSDDRSDAQPDIEVAHGELAVGFEGEEFTSSEDNFEQANEADEFDSLQSADTTEEPTETETGTLTPESASEDFESFQHEEEAGTVLSDSANSIDSAVSMSETIESEVAVDESTMAHELNEDKEEEMTNHDVAAPERKNESVADLLARMKEEGQWSGIPDENDQSEAGFDAAPMQAEPEPSYADDYNDSNEEDEADVEDYMSQLLSRMRGGASAQPVKKEVPQQKVKEPVKKEPVPETPVKPLRPEEFVPKQKAKKIESLGAMRELANSTARTAVKSSEFSRRRALAYLQLGIGVASLVMSGYYFGVESTAFADMGFLIGLLCIGVTAFLGYRFYKTMGLIKEDGGMLPAKQKTKSDTDANSRQEIPQENEATPE